VHLQCNAGQDTLSLAQLGAEVTGVDISDEAIAFASRLSAESGVNATFVRADVYDWLEETARTDERFDVAFSSYGAICWLSDLDTWAQGIAAVLKRGGRLILVDYHPFAGMLNEQRQFAYPYSTSGRATTWDDGVSDYVAFTGETATGYRQGIVDFVNPHRDHQWFWGLGEIVNAILGAGLRLETLNEYPWSNGWKMFHDMRQLPGRRWALPEGVPIMPLMYGIVARKD
jgi:SAM-dependent methyltransferase